MLEYNYNKEIKILFTQSSGNNTIKDIVGHYQYLSQTKEYHEDLKVLIDIREVVLNVNPDELNEVYGYLLKAVKNLGTLTEAILVKKPYETAIATLFEKEFSQINNYIFKVFYTDEAALNWLAGL